MSQDALLQTFRRYFDSVSSWWPRLQFQLAWIPIGYGVEASEGEDQ